MSHRRTQVLRRSPGDLAAAKPLCDGKAQDQNTRLDAKATAKLIRVMGVVGESTPTARGAIVPIIAENNIADATNWGRVHRRYRVTMNGSSMSNPSMISAPIAATPNGVVAADTTPMARHAMRLAPGLRTTMRGTTHCRNHNPSVAATR